MDATSLKKRKTLTLSRKLEAVAFAERVSNSAAARHFQVSRQQIIKWRKAKVSLEAEVRSQTSECKKQRLHGGGRKLKFSVLNDRVRDWIINREKREPPKCVAEVDPSSSSKSSRGMCGCWSA